MRGWLLSVFLVLLSACTVGPDYVQPDIETPERWSVDISAAEDLTDTAWWTRFGDPVLDRLVERAVRRNLDLKIATARIDQFIGQLEVARAEALPRVDGAVSIGTGRSGGQSTESIQATLNSQWEIDLWGRIRRANEAARARLIGSKAGRRAVLMTLVSNVAGSYVTLRGLDRQLAIARQSAQAYAESLDLMRLRYEYGAISQLELRQAESLLESARQAIPRFESLVRQQENLLAVLLGDLPGAIPRGREIDRLTPPAIPAGLPSTLLERRPDILQAEQALVAANAEIGVARAAYFPTISLTGLLGSVSGELDGLFSGGTGQSSLAGGLAAPLLNWGAIAGQVAQAESLQQQALFQYQQTLLNAFREVEDALVKTIKGREEAAARQTQTRILNDVASLARLRFDGGTTDYLQVLDA
ncbi:MAG: efflux transporter outer membrane subunit, partial [Desulfobacteraceae bacterium]|nr:efflux transporter outer membrane subunit [Desulfobacteraceae bacterium]